MTIERASKVAEVLVAHLHPKYKASNITPLARAQPFHLAKQFLECKEHFRASGKPIQAEVAFHYTNKKKLASIETIGLQPSMPNKHGSVYGSGIYVATNPHAFMSYGDSCIVLLYLPGCTRTIVRDDPIYAGHASNDDGVDTVKGNKLTVEERRGSSYFPKSPYFDEVVLKRSQQALPLLVFPRETLNNAELIFELQVEFQWLVDKVLNGSRSTIVQRIHPSFEDIQFEHSLRMRFLKKAGSALKKPIQCKGPKNKLKSRSVPCTVIARPPSTECPICMESLNENGPSVCLNKCGHSFHGACVNQALMTLSTCPICRAQLLESFGNCPKGTLSVVLKPHLHCDGHQFYGTYQLTYHIPDGVQGSCHDSPGHGFRGTIRKAFVPNVTSAGRDLVKRLQYAFARGLTFTVGTSLTSGKSNVVVWTSIHHKTATAGQPYGFPDPGYFFKCNEELDAAGVPQATNL
jgi:deltex-like protein